MTYHSRKRYVNEAHRVYVESADAGVSMSSNIILGVFEQRGVGAGMTYLLSSEIGEMYLQCIS